MNRRASFHWLVGAIVMLAWATAPVRASGAPPAAVAHALPKNPDRLWQWVHEQCEPAARRMIYPPAPCIEVSGALQETTGYAVFKDRDGAYQYLVLPLARITGIESETLLAPNTPNYLADAWEARRYIEAALHASVPRDELSLVVNSAYGRSQNQLHIHIDCIRADVHDALQRLAPTITQRWTTLSEPLPPHGHRYSARWVPGDSLAINPFQSLAASLPRGDRMALHSLVIVGARSPDGQPGFIMLSGKVDPTTGDRGNADDLQDQACAMVTRHAP